jgi:hypothetical protein
MPMVECSQVFPTKALIPFPTKQTIVYFSAFLSPIFPRFPCLSSCRLFSSHFKHNDQARNFGTLALIRSQETEPLASNAQQTAGKKNCILTLS